MSTLKNSLSVDLRRITNLLKIKPHNNCKEYDVYYPFHPRDDDSDDDSEDDSDETRRDDDLLLRSLRMRMLLNRTNDNNNG